jgi:hypothetical protein
LTTIEVIEVQKVKLAIDFGGSATKAIAATDKDSIAIAMPPYLSEIVRVPNFDPQVSKQNQPLTNLAAMMAWGEEVLSEIEEVSMDMTGNYKYLVNQICPNALVTVDRFHVMKVVNSELNRGRISQLGENKV